MGATAVLKGVQRESVNFRAENKNYLVSISERIVFKTNKTKQTKNRKRDQTCGYPRWKVGAGGIGGRWSKGTNFQVSCQRNKQ